MSRPVTKVAAATNRPANSTHDATARAVLDASGILQTLQGHVDDLRNLLQCGICIRPLYEPFTLACGHTFCYSCLTSWFGNGKSSKTCPDCRASVKSQPAPAYLVRAMVQLFTSRAELLEKEETTAEHRRYQQEEARKLERDKTDLNPKTGGLFHGIFKEKLPAARPIIDLEDDVVRCPHCNWELEDGGTSCERCGFRDDSESVTATESGAGWTDSEENSDMTDYMDEVEDGFDDAGDDFHFHDFYGLPFDFHPLDDLRGRNWYHDPTRPRNGPYGLPFSDTASTHDESEEDEDFEDDEMASFIDDDEHDDDQEESHDDGEQDYDSQSDRSTVVGGPGYSLRDLHDDIQIGTDVSTSGASGSHIESGGENSSEDDDDDDEDPIRPPIVGNRRRGAQQPNRLGSSNFRPALGLLDSIDLRSLNQHSFACGRENRNNQAIQTTGLSAQNAVQIDDDSDEGPVRPTRRTRGRMNCL